MRGSRGKTGTAAYCNIGGMAEGPTPLILKYHSGSRRRSPKTLLAEGKALIELWNRIGVNFHLAEVRRGCWKIVLARLSQYPSIVATVTRMPRERPGEG